eukprot:3751881-Prorocentrum_lima.AAC.1
MKWYWSKQKLQSRHKEEIAERDRELRDRNRHQESKEKERYQELSNHFNHAKAKHAELKRTLQDLQKRSTPDP